MAKKQRYLKMGEKSPAFADPVSGVILSGKMVVQVTGEQWRSHKVAKARLGGHLTEADKEDYEAWVEFEASTRDDIQVKTATDNRALLKENEELRARLAELEGSDETPPISKMNSKALVKYYKDNYEVTDEQVEEFKSLDIDDKRKFLEDAENE